MKWNNLEEFKSILVRNVNNVFFITDRKNVEYSGLTTLNSKQGIKRLHDFYENNREVYIDTETTGLDERTAKLLLTAIGNEEIQFVIDNTTVNIKETLSKYSPKVLHIGHNIKYDFNMFQSTYNVQLDFMYDTMIAEQRLFMGFGKSEKNPMGIKFSLGSSDKFQPDSLLYRYLKMSPEEQDKNIRKDFSTMDERSDFTASHILYAAGDIKYLPFIKQKQQMYAEKYNMIKIIDVEQDLIRFVGECELEGFIINKEKWFKNIANAEKGVFESQCKLDDIIRELRTKAPKKNVKFLIGGKFDRNRREKVKVLQYGLDLFETSTDKEITEKSKKNTFINYSSPKEIVSILGYLGSEVPTKEDEYKIPYVSENGEVETAGFTTEKKTMELFVIERPLSKAIEFVEELINYRKYITRVNNFGEKWFNNYVKPNGRAYTRYRQCTAVNGRFQSGGGKENETDRFNSQNVIATKEYRTCFGVEPKYSVTTCDLSGAEVTIMADKANDKVLYELAVIKDDVHSPVITNGWRNIYLYRAGKKLGLWDYPKEFAQHKANPNYLKYLKNTDNEEVKKLYELSKTFLVDKKTNPHLRKSGKNLTFGIVYGCKAKKAGKTINVSVEEGQVYINSVKEIIPNTIQYVESNVKFAKKNGYLIIDKRSGSRIWFPSAIKAIQSQMELDYYAEKDLDGEARNIPISGTQANMIKESIVEIGKYIKLNKLDCALLVQVHDELAYRQPREMDGKSQEFKDNPVYCKYYVPNHKFEVLEQKEDGRTICEIDNVKFTAWDFDLNFGGELGVELYLDFPTVVKLIMCRVANSYLENFTMKAEHEVEDTWIK